MTNDTPNPLSTTPTQPVQPAVQQPVAPVQAALAPTPQMVQPAATAATPAPVAAPAPQVVQQVAPAPTIRPPVQQQQQTAPVQVQPRPNPQTMGSVRPGQQKINQAPTRQAPNPKKLIFGCIGCSGVLLVFFILFVLVFVAQTTSSGENPLARSLGIDTGSFINTLIIIVNVVFGSIAVLLFLLAVIGLFRLGMARKDDKEAKRRGVTMAGVSGFLLFFSVFIWIGIYVFLSSKRVTIPKTQVNAIYTEPAQTLGLTAPITIVFDASGLPISKQRYEILSYLWNFGDGDSSTVALTSHTYTDKGSNNGRFDVSVQVSKKDKQNGKESVDTYTTIVTIANVELNASFTADPEVGPAPLSVTFDASESSAPAGEITSYDWDFDNNNNFNDASGVTADYEFKQVGTYTVGLRVTDNTGQFKVTTKEITVSGANIPKAVIDIPTKDGKYYTNVQYSFQAEKSTSPNGKVEKYEWDFGDGTPKANTRTANHLYKNAGTFDVALKVTDEEGETGESVQKVKIEQAESAPLAVIKTVPAPADGDTFITGTVPFEVAFDGIKSQDSDNNIVDYKWDFDGDGQNDSVGSNVNYVYKQEGLFNATLTVVDAEGNESSVILVVKVGSQPLTARLSATPVEGVTPLTVTFDASGSSYPDGQIVSYEWDFGDGSAKRIDVSKVTYKYTKIGTFTAKVTAIASDSTRSTVETPVNVRPVSLTACFEASAEQGEAPLTVDFDPRCSTGTISKYSWDFGDGENSKSRKATHTFNSPGSYKVILEVADNQNVINVFTKNILVTGSL